MANLKDLIVNGAARVIGKTYSSEFVGNLTGNVTGNAKTATTADKTAYGISVKDAASNLAVNGWNGSAAGNLTIAGTSPVTTTATGGKIAVSHDNSGVTAGTYKSVTVDAKGHVTAGTNPTTLSGYGISDAKIASGVITLGSNTITPLTSASTLAAGKVSGTLAASNIPNLDASKITTGTISVDRLPATALERCVVVADDTARFKLTTSSVQVGDTVKVTATKKMYMVIDSSKLSSEAGYEEYFTSTDWSTITNKPSSYTPSSHTHTKSQITDFPTKMPASDVYDWAKAKTKPSYAWSEITNKPSAFTPATHSHDAATQSANGFMSAADKKKLDGITESADSVSFSRSLTSGTKVGTITINGTGTDLYAPTNTDTHHTAKNVVASSSTGTANVTAATSNPYLNLIENGAVRSTHQIKGSGATTVKTDTSGNIVISSTDTNTHYTATPVLGATNAVANATSKTSDPYFNIVENGGKSGGIQIKGSGATSVSAINGIITISSTDTNTTYSSKSAASGGTDVSLVTTGEKYTWNSKANGTHNHTKSQITDFPTKMPASDVYDWAKAKTKPSYAWSEITSKPSSFTPATHSHDAATQSANGFMSSTDKAKLDGILGLVYPVGSIYMSVNSTSPAELFGGTWESLKDRFLVGAGNSYSINATGGSSSHTHTTGGHTLTENEIPKHTHGEAGGHTHTRGDMNITGNWSDLDWGNGVAPWPGRFSGALYNIGTQSANDARSQYNQSGKLNGIGFEAAKNWYGKTSSDGSHTHSSVGAGWSHSHGDTGSSSNIPPYLAVYMWKRTA